MKWILCAVWGIASPAWALISQEAISFYKSPQSLFASGQASRSDLERRTLRSETELRFHVEWDQRTFEIPASELLREIQVLKQAQVHETTLLRQSPRSDGGFVATLKAQTKVDVRDAGVGWAEVESPEGRRGWIPLTSLQAIPEDIGVAVTFVDSFLKESPNNDSRVITTLSQGTRLKNYSFIKNNSAWLKVETSKASGFIDINQVYVRADFAKWAYHLKLGWLQVQHREGASLRTADGLRFPVSEFTSFRSHPHRAFVLKAMNQGPQLRSRVEIRRLAADRWVCSQLDDHGEVWWKKESLPLAAPVERDEKISSEELLKREVFSMAFSDSKKLKGLVSARGIYRTLDGKSWEKISVFENQDHPVAVHGDGVWYVGAHRSFDEGKTFEPYIRWDLVAEALSEKNINSSSMMKILKIETLKSPFIHVLLDTGVRRIVLQTHIRTQSWRAVK